MLSFIENGIIIDIPIELVPFISGSAMSLRKLAVLFIIKWQYATANIINSSAEINQVKGK